MNLFPDKKVYAVGNPASRFKFFGSQDKIDDINTNKALCIVLDTPDIKRIDGANINNFEYVIKIDHHPIIDKYANIEVIDDNACSSSQLILEFANANKIKIDKESAEKLFLGIVGDTDRFYMIILLLLLLDLLLNFLMILILISLNFIVIYIKGLLQRLDLKDIFIRILL